MSLGDVDIALSDTSRYRHGTRTFSSAFDVTSAHRSARVVQGYAYNGAAVRVIRLKVARMSYRTSSAGIAGSRLTIS